MVFFLLKPGLKELNPHSLKCGIFSSLSDPSRDTVYFYIYRAKKWAIRSTFNTIDAKDIAAMSIKRKKDEESRFS